MTDRIKAVDVPWKRTIVIFALFIIGIGVAFNYVSQNSRLPTEVIWGMFAGFAFLELFLVMVLTCCMFRNEEIRDSKHLAKLHNDIKQASDERIGLLRMNKKVKNLRAQSHTKLDQGFLHSLNLLRMSAN